MQLLLIQTQVMKVDMESALMQMDQIMRANRLTRVRPSLPIRSHLSPLVSRKS